MPKEDEFKDRLGDEGTEVEIIQVPAEGLDAANAGLRATNSELRRQLIERGAQIGKQSATIAIHDFIGNFLLKNRYQTIPNGGELKQGLQPYKAPTNRHRLCESSYAAEGKAWNETVDEVCRILGENPSGRELFTVIEYLGKISGTVLTEAEVTKNLINLTVDPKLRYYM